MVKREDVEQLLRDARAIPSPVTIAACEAWLALDAAPVGKVKEVGGSLVMIGELSEPYRATAHPVRLVPETTGARMRGVG